ncbi:histidine phosphatase family protein [Mesorhizobium sp. AaZ16]|uniref:histidine phosphatase family protein n=1 Tax=Mesorhizobium sp. AaZ16 TaxID=3402289 RepID=UPI00374E9997
MTTIFFLVRHAAHDNVDDFLAGRSGGIVLGESGLSQAARLGQRLRRERFDAIHASPRERTQETAIAIAGAYGLTEIHANPALDEIDFGEWSGRAFEELASDPDWQRWNEDRSRARAPGGETMIEVQARVMSCIEALAKQHRGGAVVLVSHADVIKAAVCHFLGLPVQGCFRFDIAPASITTIVTGDWGGKVLGLNEIVA